MQNIILPQGLAFYDLRVALDGVTYILNFSWNARARSWYLDVQDSDGTPIVSGLAVVSNWPLLRRFKWNAALPGGELIATDLTGTYDAPGYTDLGTNVPLYYFTADEVAGRE